MCPCAQEVDVRSSRRGQWGPLVGFVGTGGGGLT